MGNTLTSGWEGTFGWCAMQKMSIRCCSHCKEAKQIFFDSRRKPFAQTSAPKAPTESKHLDNLFFGWALHDPFFCTGEEHRATRQSWIPTESPHREPMDGDLCLGRDQENGKCYLAQGLLWVAFCFFRCLQPACSCIGSKETRNSWPQSGLLQMGRRSQYNQEHLSCPCAASMLFSKLLRGNILNSGRPTAWLSTPKKIFWRSPPTSLLAHKKARKER